MKKAKHPFDFKEIPQANSGDGEQDTFEEFAQEFFYHLGYIIEEPASRGADGGKDLIAIKISKNNSKRWLISCKHYAHSGKSVGLSDEPSILDRLAQFECQGFIGFYSTLPSSSLIQRLRDIKKNKDIDYKIFNRAKIQGLLIKNRNLNHLIQIYFPESFQLVMKDYAWEKLYTTIWILAGGDRDLRFRIYDAYTSALMRVPLEQLPKRLRYELSSLFDELTSVDPIGEEGKLMATLNTMNDFDLDKVVERIVSIYDRYRGSLTINS